MVNKNTSKNNVKRSVRNKNKGSTRAKPQTNLSNKINIITPTSKEKSIPNLNVQEKSKTQSISINITKNPESEMKMEDITTASFIEESKSITQKQTQTDKPEEFKPIIDVAAETPYTSKMMENEALLVVKVIKKINKNQKRVNHVSKKGAKIGMDVEEEKMAQLIKKSKKQIGEKSKSKLNQGEKKAIIRHTAQRIIEPTDKPISHLIEITPILAEAIEDNKKNRYNGNKSSLKKSNKSLLLNDSRSHAEFVIANNSRLQNALNNSEGLGTTDVISILPQLMDITKVNALSNPMFSSTHFTYEQRVKNLTNHINLIVKAILDLIKMNENTRKTIEQQLERWLPSAVKIILRIEDYIEEHQILKKTMVCLCMCCHKQDNVEIELQ